MATKQTIFQQLGKALNPNSVKRVQPQRVILGGDALLKTASKDEYDTKKLELQQDRYLQNTWQKVEQGLYQQSVTYETTRLASYADFEAMEYYPLIASAMDTMMEESTTLNNKGRMMNIYSKSNRVKGILEDLFFNRLDLHTSLPMWVRNTFKYGDNFVLLNITSENGIIGAKQLPNYQMERREPGYASFFHNMDSENKELYRTKFHLREQNISFEHWQVAHFRLLGDDRRLPYGVSGLEKARRIWKQLILLEDAMLVYRITRAPERRVYKIFVGNIDPNDVQTYMQNIANKFKRKTVTDPQTGQVDLRYNVMTNEEDYFIPVRDENAPNPIDTLPGAQNLDQIGDVTYFRSNLFTALRVPKQFLGFDDPAGEGKNLALQDVRFARTINRIQQTMLQELNKIAITHLYLLGLEDDLDNFTLTLNNPSKQAEMLEVEHLQQKIILFKDATSDINGFAAMSMTRAKREILGWSDDEIESDFLEQRLERAAMTEMQNTQNVIKHTGIFDKVDRVYGDYQAALNGGVVQGGGGEGADDGGDGGSGGGGGGGLGGSFGGGGVSDLDFGDESDTTDGEEGGGETDGGAPEDSEEPASESSLEELSEIYDLLVKRILKGTKKQTNKSDLVKKTMVISENNQRLIDKIDNVINS